VTDFATIDESDATPEERFERPLSLPPSSKLVFKVLDERDPLTQRQIRDRALLPARTTRNALGKLADAGLVEDRPAPTDARKRLYARRRVAPPDDRIDGADF